MKVAFRVDASSYIGSGHVMRCLVIADALRNAGHVVEFWCLKLSGNLIDYIEKRGHDVGVLSASFEECIPNQDGDYLGWLQRPILVDAQDFIDCVGNVDILITDHYAIDYEWQKFVGSALSCKIVAIDDLCRNHFADLVVDQTFGRKPTEYQGVATVLSGSDYALISPRFAHLREQAFGRSLTNTKPKVLITMGAVDIHNVTQRVLEKLLEHVDAEFTVLLGQNSPHFETIKNYCADLEYVNHIDFCDDMPCMMLDHDISIGAPGSTSWERACLGLPSIIIPIAENQKDVAKSLAENGAAILVNVDTISQNLKAAYFELLENYSSYHQRSLAICDGLGVNRVVQELFSTNNIMLEKAKLKHIELIYKWQCHPQTRRFSNNSNIPSWDEHSNWMKRKLSSTSDYFYLAVLKDSKEYCGALRLDRESVGTYIVSIFLNPECYGRGVGSEILSLLDDIHPDVNIKAVVLKENTASQKLFYKSGYSKINDGLFIRKRK